MSINNAPAQILGWKVTLVEACIFSGVVLIVLNVFGSFLSYWDDHNLYFNQSLSLTIISVVDINVIAGPFIIYSAGKPSVMSFALTLAFLFAGMAGTLAVIINAIHATALEQERVSLAGGSVNL